MVSIANHSSTDWLWGSSETPEFHIDFDWNERKHGQLSDQHLNEHVYFHFDIRSRLASRGHLTANRRWR